MGKGKGIDDYREHHRLKTMRTTPLNVSDDEIIKHNPTKNYQDLAIGVLRMAVADMALGGEIQYKVEKEILDGGCDLWFAILGLRMTAEDFINLSRKNLARDID